MFSSHGFPPQPGCTHVTACVLLFSHVESSHALHGPQPPVCHTPSLGLFPVHARVSDVAGLGAEQALSQGQVTVRVPVCWPATPHSVALQAPQLGSPIIQSRLEHAPVSVSAGLLDSSQEVVPPQAPSVQVTERFLLILHVDLSQALQSPQGPVFHAAFLGLLPVQFRVSDVAGLGVGHASPHGQVTVRVRVCRPPAPHSFGLQTLQSLHSPSTQAGLGHASVSVCAGLFASSQEAVPPQAPGVQVTERLLLLLQVEPVQPLHVPHAPVTQAPSLALPPVQERDVAPAHALPPHAGVGLLQARVCVPLAPQSLAEQELHADQPPSTGLFPVQARDDEPEQLLPPHAGVGFAQDLVCVPLVPQALAEQALQPVQPPSTGLLPVQARDDEPEQLLPPHAGAGLSQVRVCVPPTPQAFAEQALQLDH